MSKNIFFDVKAYLGFIEPIMLLSQDALSKVASVNPPLASVRLVALSVTSGCRVGIGVGILYVTSILLPVLALKYGDESLTE